MRSVVKQYCFAAFFLLVIALVVVEAAEAASDGAEHPSPHEQRTQQ